MPLKTDTQGNLWTQPDCTSLQLYTQLNDKRWVMWEAVGGQHLMVREIWAELETDGISHFCWNLRSIKLDQRHLYFITSTLHVLQVLFTLFQHSFFYINRIKKKKKVCNKMKVEFSCLNRGTCCLLRWTECQLCSIRKVSHRSSS